MAQSGDRGRPLAAIVLAAGEGKRFKSGIPKMLHPLCGRPLVGYVMETLEPLQLARTVLVVGRSAEEVAKAARASTSRRLVTAVQERRLGTADAARVGDEALGRFSGDVLVVPGDTPLLLTATLERLVAHHRSTNAVATLLTSRMEDPAGYGRVVRHTSGSVARIVEDADATEAERAIAECATSVYVFERGALRSALTKVGSHNRQGELYLTDVIGILSEQGEKVEAVVAADSAEVLGVNSRVEISQVSAILRRRINERWMLQGVTIEDPAVTYIDAGVTIGPDTVIGPLSVLRGATIIGSRCRIGPGAILEDAVVGDEVTILNAVVRGARIGPGANVGPFTSLRPGTILEASSKAGSFVEIKGSRVGRGSKVPHLSYIGDAEIGRNVNVGAGTITCNYDGETGKKSKTVVGDDVLIASDTMLVAPVTIGKRAMTGAGSVVTRDVSPGQVVAGVPAKPIRKRKPATAKKKAAQKGSAKAGSARTRKGRQG